jgi:hypothetical protein
VDDKPKNERAHPKRSAVRRDTASAGSASGGRIGAQGYGLDKRQQEAIAALWDWQEDSLRGEALLGGATG